MLKSFSMLVGAIALFCLTAGLAAAAPPLDAGHRLMLEAVSQPLFAGDIAVERAPKMAVDCMTLSGVIEAVPRLQHGLRPAVVGRQLTAETRSLLDPELMSGLLPRAPPG